MKINLSVTICFLWLTSSFAVVPDAFNLSSPSNGSSGVALKPELKWSAATNAASYKVQICTYGWWSTDLVVNYYPVTATSYTLPANLNGLTYYYWRIIAYGTTGDESTSKMCSQGYWNFTTTATAPGVPTLSTPANGATNQTLTPMLTWSSVSSATDYLYQVSTSSSFSSFVANGSTNTTNWSPSTNFAYGTVYYWRIAAKNSAGSSAYSSAWNFKTQLQAVAPVAPTLSSPANGATNQPSAITFTWAATTGATSYKIQIASSSSFTTTLIDNSGITATSYPASDIPLATILYWRVQASNGTGTSPWSSVRSFTTANPNTTMTWPKGTAQTLVSMFGPRNLANNGTGSEKGGWFHTGIDMGNGNTFVAPFNMILRAKTVSRCVFECQEPGIEPKFVQFQEVAENAGSAMQINVTTFLRGAAVPLTSTFPNVHMDAFPTGSYILDDWTANNLTSKNPFQWLTYIQAKSLIENIYPQSVNGGPVTFPAEGTRKWFEVKIRIIRPDFSITKIKITLNDNNDAITTNFLENTLAQEIDWNNNICVQRNNAAIASKLASQFLTPAVWSNEKDGARIYANDMGTTDKYIAIRYFLIKDPTHVQVQLLDFNNNELDKQDFIFPSSCVGCNGTGPKPPGSLAAVQTSQGVKLTWTLSSEDTKVLFYSIYRRPASSSENPKSIAVVSRTLRSYEDRIDAPSNTLVGGQTYKYSIACIGNWSEGCNGPLKPGCTGSNCPLSCVNEQSAMVPSLPNNVLFEGKQINNPIADVKAKTGITIRSTNLSGNGSVNFTAGQTVTINDGLNIINGGKSTISTDPAVK